MNEPAWIEHDGSAVCPVREDADCERQYQQTSVRDCQPARNGSWRHVKRYRDWTAFEQQEAMGKDVPEWAWDRMESYALSDHGSYRQAFARYIAAHEQPPVDWLVRALQEAEAAFLPTGASDNYFTRLARELRNRIPNIDSLAAAGEGE